VLLVVAPEVAFTEPVHPLATHFVLQSVEEIVSVVVAAPLESVVSEGGLKDPETSVDDDVPAS